MLAVLFGALAGALLRGPGGDRPHRACGSGAEPEVGARDRRRHGVRGRGRARDRVARVEASVQPGDLWPFCSSGMLVPGASQILFIRSVRDAGPSRASILIGTAPLMSVLIALTLLDEPFHVALVAGTVLVVAGGAALDARARRDRRLQGARRGARADLRGALRGPRQPRPLGRARRTSASARRRGRHRCSAPPRCSRSTSCSSGAATSADRLRAAAVAVRAGGHRARAAATCCLLEAFYHGRVSRSSRR